LDAAIARAVSLQASARFATAHEFGDALAAKTMTRAVKRVTRPPQPVPQGPPPDPLHPPAPQPPRDVHVTSDRLYWPPVCACCCRSADTAFVVDYVREAGRRSSQTTHRSWRVPYCSRCAHHAVTYHEAAQQVVTRAKVMWIVCTVALCCTLGALLGLVEWAVALLAVAIVVISGMLLARKEKTDARTLMQDTCADVDYNETPRKPAPLGAG